VRRKRRQQHDSAALAHDWQQLLNEEVVWKTKQGELVHVLISYVQSAYQGGHISFVGGKRLHWVYDITAVRQREVQLAEQQRQFHEMLECCPAGLVVVDEDGRLLFHNARLREMLGYAEDEMKGLDTTAFWHDLGQRSQIIDTLRKRGGQLLNEEVVWKTKQGELVHVLISYVQSTFRGGHMARRGKRLHWFDITALKRSGDARRQSEQRLAEAIEISEGFACYDADDRLVLCSSCYRELLYPDWKSTGSGDVIQDRSRAERGYVRMRPITSTRGLPRELCGTVTREALVLSSADDDG
jgi:PAS domain S-box-containing protein